MIINKTIIVQDYFSDQNIVFGYVSIDKAIDRMSQQDMLDKFTDVTKIIMHEKVSIEDIVGTARVDSQISWSFEDGKICHSGSLLQPSLILQKNHSDLVNGWPNPTPPGNYISLMQIPNVNRYYISGNGNSRVGATWNKINNGTVARQGYFFHCRINKTEYNRKYLLLERAIANLRRYNCLDYQIFVSQHPYNNNQITFQICSPKSYTISFNLNEIIDDSFRWILIYGRIRFHLKSIKEKLILSLKNKK